MKIGFYGFGHLAKAVASGLLTKELCAPADLFILAKSEQTKEDAKNNGFHVSPDGETLFKSCDIVFLAIKPAVFKELKASFSKTAIGNTKIVSLMASIGLCELQETFGQPVLRVMPTIAIKEGHDIIGMTDPTGFEEVAALFEKLGKVHLLDEQRLDSLTVAASCGPGFAAKVLESYAASCMKLGFSKEQALSITAAIFSFAASRQGEDPFKTLKEQVATKGGVTEAGNLAMGNTLEEAFDFAFTTALKKASPKKQD